MQDYTRKWLSGAVLSDHMCTYQHRRCCVPHAHTLIIMHVILIFTLLPQFSKFLFSPARISLSSLEPHPFPHRINLQTGGRPRAWEELTGETLWLKMQMTLCPHFLSQMRTLGFCIKWSIIKELLSQQTGAEVWASMQEAETRALQLQGQPELHSEPRLCCISAPPPFKNLFLGIYS